MQKVDLLTAGTYQPGIYWLHSPMTPEAVRVTAEGANWRFVYLNGSNIEGKADFLKATAAAFNFPHYFGHNWDAFEESIQDLSWASASGYLVLYDNVSKFAANQPADWRTALAILESTVRYWRKEGRPMYILLRDGADFLLDIEWL